MQELKFKKEEMIKINGKRFFVKPSTSSIKIKEVSKEEERLICKELLDRTYAKEFKLRFGNKADSNGDMYYEVYDADTATSDKYYLKYLRLINNPSYYELPKIENEEYYLYCDHENDKIELFKVSSKGTLIDIEKNFREKLLNGEVIK